MNKSVSPELVAEVVRFSTQALHRKAAELAQVAQDAESPAEALLDLSYCMRQDGLLELAQDPLFRVATGAPLYPQVLADALYGFGGEADALRALLAEHEATAAE